MKLFNTIAASVAVAMAAGVAQADTNSQLASLQAQVNQLQAQVNSMGSTNNVGNAIANYVGIDSNLSWQMMGNMPGVGKEITLLQARQAGLNTPITVGGYAQGDFLYQHTSQNGYFNNSAVFPAYSITGNNSSSASELALSNADLAFTAAIGNWATAYLQAGATNFGTGANTYGNNNSDTVNLQDAYLVIGNLAKAPVYGFVGKKDIDFGSFATVDMYAQPLNRQFFSALGDTLGVGVNAYGFNGVVSVMNNGQNGTNMNTSTSNSNAKNFAVNLGYGMTNSGINWNVGAGYLYGTQFLSTTNGTNGAWDVNGKLSVAGFDLLAEYTITSKQTYGTSVYANPSAGTSYLPGAAGTASHAYAWDLGADYNFPIMGLNSAVSAEYSSAKLNGISNDNYSPKQVSLGYRIQPVSNVWTGIEYDWNRGVVYNGVMVAGPSGITTNTVLLDVTAAF